MDDAKRAEGALGGFFVQSERKGETHVIGLAGELDLGGAPRLEDELRRAEATDASSIVVDLQELEFIDSTGLRLLLMAAERSRDSGRLTLIPGPPQVQRVFELTDLVARLPFAAG